MKVDFSARAGAGEISVDGDEFSNLLNENIQSDFLALERGARKELPGDDYQDALPMKGLSDFSKKLSGDGNTGLLKELLFSKADIGHSPNPLENKNYFEHNHEKLLQRKNDGLYRYSGGQGTDGQIANKDGIRISLKWKDGKIVKNSENMVSKEYQGEKFLKTNNNIFFKNYNDERNNQSNIKQDNLNKIASYEELLPKSRSNNEFFSYNEDGLNVKNSDKSELLKLKKMAEGLSESSHDVDLQYILGIKNNEASSNSDFNDDLNILKLNDVKNIDAKNLIGRIKDYLIQNGIKNLDFLEVVVEHEDLGRFKIDAQKAGMKGQIDLKIEVMTAEGRDFFQKNESLLAKELSGAGVNIQEFKIVDSKENALLSSFSLKGENDISNLEKDVQREEKSSQHENRKNKKDERYFRSKEERMNEEEENDWHR